jgi:hypothetical protein
MVWKDAGRFEARRSIVRGALQYRSIYKQRAAHDSTYNNALPTIYVPPLGIFLRQYRYVLRTCGSSEELLSDT